MRHVIQHAAHLLPAQGPITVFIHHNTLHAFEDQPFPEAVVHAARVYGCHPFLPEDRYREELIRGRIRTEDLFAVLLDDLGESADQLVGFMGTRFHLRLAMLQYPLQLAPAPELRWLAADTDALRRFRPDAPTEIRLRMIEQTRHWVMRELRGAHPPAFGQAAPGARVHAALVELLERFGVAGAEGWNDSRWEAFCLHALWRICQRGARGIPPHAGATQPPVRHRDVLLAATGSDSDQLVHEVLIRFCAACADQGLSHWPLAHREDGFFRAFVRLYGQSGGPPDRWRQGLARELQRQSARGGDALDSIQESLELLGVAPVEYDAFLSATLLALRGWAGMLWQLETRGDRVALPAPPGTLLEFLAVRLILERLALADLAQEAHGGPVPLAELRGVFGGRGPARDAVGSEQRAFLVFQLAQVLGWTPPELLRLSQEEWATLVQELEAFSSIDRRRVFHLAYERRFQTQVLDAFAVRGRQPAVRPDRPRFQLICCIDERNESLRRHLEEHAPDVETFGAAGFFNVAMYYRGSADASFVPLCPIVVRPRHSVREQVAESHQQSHRRRALFRRALGSTLLQMHVGSRTFTWGALVAAVLGPLAMIPLIARVLFPRLTARLRRLTGHFVQPPRATDLELERAPADTADDEREFGFTVDEMAVIVESLLRDVGLTQRFGRLVILLGHGATSLNNPHESAYNCGACGGARGGPNARAFARMANDPRVRQRLALRGLRCPAETVFVGGLHNTTDDRITWSDIDRLPATHAAEFAAARRDLEGACERNAHERCRRFESAPLELSRAEALRHVEGRAADLAQARPECGHATNAICVIGRRSRTRGLFLDRRAFLVSYDPAQDDETGAILGRVLQAVVPVCAGISLEYYFSYVDPAGWGCGTKLPHNIAALLGVMDGAASDLRSGLPWQMVEIHEPLRQWFIVETPPERMLEILRRQPDLERLCRNGWIHLATLCPKSSELHVFQAGRFERYQPQNSDLPEVAVSVDWYRGWRDHLGFALVRSDVEQHQDPIAVAERVA